MLHYSMMLPFTVMLGGTKVDEFLVINWGEEIVVAEIKLPNKIDGCVRVTYHKLWEILQEAKQLNLKLSIYEIGDCILDWS